MPPRSVNRWRGLDGVHVDLDAYRRARTDATLRRVDDMGHDLPEPLWPALTDAVAAHARAQP